MWPWFPDQFLIMQLVVVRSFIYALPTETDFSPHWTDDLVNKPERLLHVPCELPECFCYFEKQFLILSPVAVFTGSLLPLISPNLSLCVKLFYVCFFMHALSCSEFSGNNNEAGKSSTVVPDTEMVSSHLQCTGRISAQCSLTE